MEALVEQFGHKSAGQLIKSDDWNRLVAAIEGNETELGQRIDTLTADVQARFQAVDTQIQNLNTTLSQRIDALAATVDAGFQAVNGQIQNLDTQVSQLATEFGTFRATIEPLLRRYYRLTMQTAKVSYAIGEPAEITARVTDLQGNPLDLANEADRPWIEFVAAWGQLKPVAGFQSRGGVGDRTIAVRVNAEGIAQVRLRPDHVEGLTDEVEDEVAASLTTRLAVNNRSIVDTILEAATPIEAKAAYRTLSAEYDRPDAVSVRTYVDAYYLKYGAQVADGRIAPTFRHRWRDYRATVMAFASSDGDPRTPDQSLGVSSIQVTFRDWIGPWIILDYMVETGPLVQDFRNRLAAKVSNDFSRSTRDVKAEVSEFVRGKGLVGKQRDYQVVRHALDELIVPQPPPFLNTLTKSVQDAVSIQQALESAQVAAVGLPSQEVAFEVFTDAAVRADTSVAGVAGDLAALQQQVRQVQQSFGNVNTQVSRLQTSVSTLGGRLDATLAEGGELRRLQTSLATVSQQVQVLRDLDPSRVQTKLLEIDSLSNRLERIERG